MTSDPLISCILATKNRRRFLGQAIHYFERQRYPNKELVIVDDGHKRCDDMLGSHPAIRYVPLKEETVLGTKLNLGIEAASGAILQKWDDDDYYHPNYLKTQVDVLLHYRSEEVIVCHDRFLVYLAAVGKLKQVTEGWCAGGTLCFYRSLWKQAPFQPVGSASDWIFLHDHGFPLWKISGTELYILIRHGLNSWNQIGDESVDLQFSRLMDYPKRLPEIMGREDAAFYDFYRVDALKAG